MTLWNEHFPGKAGSGVGELAPLWPCVLPQCDLVSVASGQRKWSVGTHLGPSKSTQVFGSMISSSSSSSYSPSTSSFSFF